MSFQSFYVGNLLAHTGWPRRRGIIFKRQYVDKTVLQLAVDQLVQLGIVIGAVNPGTAIRLFAEAFRGRDFGKQPPDDLLEWVFPDEQKDSELDELASSINKWIFPPAMPDAVPWEIIRHESFQVGYHGNFVKGLGYGLKHPTQAISAYERYVSGIKSMLPLAIKAGLDIDANQVTQSIRGYEGMCLDIVKEFEKDVHPLLSPCQELLELPALVGRLK